MVSPLVRRNLPPAAEVRQSNGGQRYPSPIHRRSQIANGRQSPLGMTIVSPASSIASISHMGMPSPVTKETTTSMTQASTVNSSRRLNHHQRSSPLAATLQRSPLPPTSASSFSKTNARRASSSRSGENREPTEAEVKVLHARFNAIQMGLGSIDQERALLVDKSKKLEDEKKELERQLQLRDNEIIALVKRCASQEERMREYSKLKAANRGLSDELQSVTEQLETSQHESASLVNLRNQLNKSELAREELQKRLNWVHKEHDSIAETLSDCLENIRTVTEEKEQLEDERRRERKRAEMELEKQRLSIRQISQSFQMDIETKQQRIDQMELLLHQNNLSDATSAISSASGSVKQAITKYESQIYEMQRELDHYNVDKDRMNDILDARLTKTVEKYEQQIEEMKRQLDRQESDQKAAADYQRQISTLQHQLMISQEKENKVLELEKEIEYKEESNQQILQTAVRYEQKITELKSELDRQATEVKNKEQANNKFNDMKDEMEQMMKQIMATHDAKVAKMQSQLDEQVTDMESKNGKIDKKFEAMKAKLEERGNQMTELESEFSEQMEQLMNKQVTLDKTEEEKKQLEARIASLQQIESEHGALVQYAEIMESNVADLTAENGILVVEKATLSDEKAVLQEKLSSLEDRVSDLREKHIAQEGEMKGRLEAEKTQLMADIEKERERVASTEDELQKRESWIIKIENDLNESRRLIAEKEDEVEKSRKSQQKVREELEASLSDARGKIAGMEDKLEWERTIQNQQSDASEEIESLSTALQNETNRASSSEKRCIELEEDLNGLIAELSERDQELEKMVEVEKYHAVQDQLSDAVSQVDRLEAHFQQAREKSMSLTDELNEFANLRDEKEELEIAKEHLLMQLANEETRTRKLEEKIDSLLSSSQDMVVELDKATSRLEEEATGWIRKEQDWEEVQIRLEDENESLEGQLAAAHEEISLLEEELERRDRRIESLISEVEALDNNGHEEVILESERQRLVLENKLADVRRQVKETTQNLEDKVTRMEKLNGDLEKVQAALDEKDGMLENTESRCSELTAKVASLETLLSTREESLMKIDEDLDSTINEIAEKEAEIFVMKQAIDAKDAEINSVMKEMKVQKEEASHLIEKLSNAETKNVTYQEVLGKQTNVVSTLQKEVEITIDSKKQRTSELEKTIRKMKTEIALKDDEIRDLRTVDLKDAEEEIALLRASLQSSQEAEAEVTKKASELSEKQKRIDDLVLKQSLLEQREQDMLSECEKLLKSESHARKLLVQKEAEMESLLARERKSVEMNQRKTSDTHKQEVLNLQGDLDATKAKLKDIEGMVKERSTLLAGVVDHNKELETKMNKQQRQLSGMEEEVKEGRHELECKRDEIAKLRREHLDKESSLRKQLQEKRRNLESTERSLEIAKRQHSDAAKYKKQLSEYEKEIDALQDKVKRQEAYMQKKLLNDRGSSRSMGTPNRTSSSYSTKPKTPSNRRRSSGIPSAPSASSKSVLSTPTLRKGSRTSLLRTPGGMKSPGLRNDLD